MILLLVIISHFFSFCHCTGHIVPNEDALLDRISFRLQQKNINPQIRDYYLDEILPHTIFHEHDQYLSEVIELIQSDYTRNQDNLYQEAISSHINSTYKYCIFFHWLQQKISKYGIHSIIDNPPSVQIISIIVSQYQYATQKFQQLTLPLWNNFITPCLNYYLKSKRVKSILTPICMSYLSIFKLGFDEQSDIVFLTHFDKFFKTKQFSPSEDIYFDIVKNATVDITKKKKYFTQWITSKEATMVPIKYEIFNVFIHKLLMHNNHTYYNDLLIAINYFEIGLDKMLCNCDTVNILIGGSYCKFNNNSSSNLFRKSLHGVHTIWTLLIETQQTFLLDERSLNMTHSCIKQMEQFMSQKVAFLVDIKRMRDIKQWSGFGRDLTAYSSFNLQIDSPKRAKTVPIPILAAE